MSEVDKDQAIAEALKALLAGEYGAGERLGALLRPELLVVARAKLAGTCHEPEDVVHDSWLALLSWLKDRQRFEGSLLALAATICRNRCRDQLRWDSRHPGISFDRVELGGGDDWFDPLEKMMAEETRRGLIKAFARLDPYCRDLLLRNYFHGETVKAIALREGVKSLQVIYYRRGSCLKKLRELLE